MLIRSTAVRPCCPVQHLHYIPTPAFPNWAQYARNGAPEFLSQTANAQLISVSRLPIGPHTASIPLGYERQRFKRLEIIHASKTRTEFQAVAKTNLMPHDRGDTRGLFAFR